MGHAGIIYLAGVYRAGSTIALVRPQDRPSAQVTSRPLRTLTPIAHIVSNVMDNTERTIAIRTTFFFLLTGFSDFVVPRIRQANLRVTSTTKAISASGRIGIEPNTPTPSLNRRLSCCLRSYCFHILRLTTGSLQTPADRSGPDVSVSSLDFQDQSPL
jgi:hypothetical protein